MSPSFLWNNRFSRRLPTLWTGFVVALFYGLVFLIALAFSQKADAQESALPRSAGISITTVPPNVIMSLAVWSRDLQTMTLYNGCQVRDSYISVKVKDRSQLTAYTVWTCEVSGQISGYTPSWPIGVGDRSVTHAIDGQELEECSLIRRITSEVRYLWVYDCR